MEMNGNVSIRRLKNECKKNPSRLAYSDDACSNPKTNKLQSHFTNKFSIFQWSDLNNGNSHALEFMENAIENSFFI